MKTTPEKIAEAAGASKPVVAYTRFPDEFASSKLDLFGTLDEIEALIRKTTKRAKGKLPFLKLARFKDTPSEAGCYRYDANVLEITGVEGDHDCGAITPEEALERLTAAGLEALIATTPSHMKPGKGARWRVICPTSKPLPPQERARLVARVNGVLGGSLAGESFALSQAFYFGSVAGEPPVQTFRSAGQPIDLCDHLDAGAIGKPRRAEKGGGNTSGGGGRFDPEAACEAIRTGEKYHGPLMGLAGYYSHKGETEGQIAARLTNLMHEVPEGDRDARWKERLDSIPRLARDGMRYRAENGNVRPDVDPQEAFDDLSGGDGDMDPDEWLEWQLNGGPRPKGRLPGSKSKKKVRRLDPIAEMNRRHAVVRLKNRTAVACFHPGGVDFIGTRDLGALYANRPLGKGTWATGWLAHKDRREYPHGVAFDPAGRERKGVLNLWTGLAVKPDPQAACGRIVAHVRDVIADGNVDHAHYVTRWLADMVQNPGRKPGVALVLKGGKGAGKDTLAEVMARIIGRRHVAKIDKPDLLTARFNAHLAPALLAHVEEAFWAGDRSKQGVLQAIITAPTMALERKGIDPEQINSFVRVLMTTNEGWVVPASSDERRYAVFDVSDARIGDRAYFDSLHHEIDNGGLAGFLAYLLSVDLAGFEVRDVPQTEALLAQKIASLRGFDQWWFDVLRKGELPSIGDFGEDESGWDGAPQKAACDAVRDSYEHWHRKRAWQGDLLAGSEIGKRLRDFCPDVVRRRLGTKHDRPWHYCFPSLERCRELFNLKIDGKPGSIPWPVSGESDDIL